MTGVQLSEHPKSLIDKAIGRPVWDNRGEAERCANTERPLTHLIDLTDRQDEMKLTPALPDESVTHRLTEKLKPEGECLVFAGSRSRNGYGMIQFGPKMVRAHRLAWVIANGPIPDDLHVLHRCDNPPCCKIEHLFLGTQQENNADRDAKGRGRMGEFQRSITHCPKAHPYSGDNLLVGKDGKRICRVCRRDSWRRSSARARAKRNAARDARQAARETP